MNYRRVYSSIIESAKRKNRAKHCGEYFEKHHISPRSLGGDNSIENTVLLTAREHFLAHWLLWKIEQGANKDKMAYAFFKMCRKSEYKSSRPRVTGYKYEIARKANSEAMRNLHLNKSVSLETRKKMSEAKKGEKTSGNKNNFFQKKHSTESKQKISNAMSRRQSGSNNSNAKLWEIIFPSGEIHKVKSLKTFCDELGKSVRDMRMNRVLGYTFIGEASCNYSD